MLYRLKKIFVKVFFRKELFTINMSITDIDSIANELSEVFASLDFVFDHFSVDAAALLGFGLVPR